MDRRTSRAAAARTVPQQRIAEKLDDYMSRRDYAGAERHLEYWLEEALAIGDVRGELMLRNELVGHFRKTGNAGKAFEHAEAALRAIDVLDFGDTLSAGTTYTNIATAYNAFARNGESLALFRKAAALYEGSPATDPKLLGGLYNNMALTCIALERFDEADDLYRKALDTMAWVPHGELEQAITYLNMADAAVARFQAEGEASAAGSACAGNPEGATDGWGHTAGNPGGGPQAQAPGADGPAPDAEAACERAVEALLDRALELLDTPGIPHDGYYAFVCEKCAPVFAHYGFFLADEDLRERAQAIYERA